MADPTPIPKGFDPYGHFWWPADSLNNGKALSAPYGGETFVPAELDLFSFLRLSNTESDGGGGDGFPLNAVDIAKGFFGGGRWAAMPERIINAGWTDESGVGIRSLEDGVRRVFPGDPPDLPDEAIIIGVIDTGVPLHHRRSMFRAGVAGAPQSRILAAWQQSATAPQGEEDRVPFGAALGGPEIDDLIAKHTRSAGGLDETAFNRAAGLTQPLSPLGHRDLDFQASHGAHVLDLAGGMDPDADLSALPAALQGFQERVRFIVVNLPPPALFGAAGAFLQYYASFALQWIVDVADWLWLQKPGRTDRLKRTFPVALNLSFGMHAGPKDGGLPFEIRDPKLRQARLGHPDQIPCPAHLQIHFGNAKPVFCLPQRG